MARPPPPPSDQDPPEPAPSAPVQPGTMTALLREIAAAPAAEVGAGWEAALRPGEMVGRFELVRELGRGGFGVVWEARDPQLGRSVALKAVRAGARRDLREERLLREAESAARLSHPNIVTLFDVGRADAGPYLVLELLKGETLEERIAKGPIPVPEAVRIFGEIARGVAHAHGEGVVHRDLKPANVFLCQDGRVKVLDFGLAHAFGQRLAGGGTSGYMAPEQVEGAPEDERTDVWALGVMLFEMLSGRRPFPDEKAVRKAAPALEVAGVPALGELTARMLSPRPVDRPRDGGEVLEALAPLEREVPRGTATASATVRTRRRSPWVLVGAGVAVGIAVALVALQSRSKGGSTSPDGRVVVAVADVVNETGERELDVLSGLLVTSLEQSRKLSVMTQARVLDLAIRAGRKDAARVDETIGREVGAAHGVRALLLPAIRKLGTTYSLEMRAIDPGRDQHLFTFSDRATSKEALLDLLDRLSERTRTELGEPRDEVGKASVQLGEAMTRSLDAYQHYLSGLEAWLRDGLRAVGLREFEEALRLDPGFAAAHVQIASLLHHSYDLPELAVPHWKAAEAGLDRMPEKERLLYRLMRAHASSTFEHFSREEALRLADEALARFPEDKYALVSAADAFETFDLPERWEPALRRALALDPGYYWAAAILANDLGARTADALDVARKAVATRRSPANLSILAPALWATGDESGAVSTAREVLGGEGRRHSLLAFRACEVLREKGLGKDCLPVWTRMTEEGLNEHERDFARARLMDGLVHQGRIREALRLARTKPAFVRVVSPWWLASILVVGRLRTDAPEALEVARRIPNPQFRRNFLTWLGATEEADRITTSLDGKGYGLPEKTNRAMRLLNRGQPGEAAEILAGVREEAYRRNWVFSWFGLARTHAEALLAAGRPEAAAEIGPAALPCRCSDVMDHANGYPSLGLIRAQAMEQLGRRADAIRELDGVLAFWKEADPDLPLLLEAKAMRKRLAAQAAAGKTPKASAPTATEAEAPTPSIAVLPFADMSPGKDQEYLSDGIAEEILNALARVRGLKVAGRTSSFSFKGRNADLRTIGRKLGVAAVLEGSVRKDGGRVRVTAQLVKAEDGFHLWSERYDRELTGVFAVQDEIARAVAARVAPLLAGKPGGDIATTPAASPEAYDWYLVGKQALRLNFPEAYHRAADAYEKAVALDPAYAPAWAGLAFAAYWSDHPAPERAMAAAERAVALDPDSADALTARGHLRALHRFDWDGAGSDFDRARTLHPENPDVLRRHAQFLLRPLGRFPEAIGAVRRATELDPLSPHAWTYLAALQLATGGAEASRRAAERALEISPKNVYAQAWRARALLVLRRFDDALASAQRANDLAVVAIARHELGQEEESWHALAELMAGAGLDDPVAVAEVHAWSGERDRAFEWLDRALARRDRELVWLKSDVLLRNLHADSRFAALLRRLNLPVD